LNIRSKTTFSTAAAAKASTPMSSMVCSTRTTALAGSAVAVAGLLGAATLTVLSA
jgi:hypothetical protein